MPQYNKQSRAKSSQTARVHSTARKKSGVRRQKRLGIIFFGFILTVFSVLLLYQLYQIQIVDHSVYAQRAAAQHYRTVVEQPKRGHIFDRNGVELAGTTYIHQIGITPKDVYSISQSVTSDQIAAGIASALELDVNNVTGALSQTDATYILLKKDATREQAEHLKQFLADKNVGGVRIDTESRRYYTNGLLASQLIGFCRYDQNKLSGQLGIELEYDEVLSGRPGYTYVETDNYDSQGSLPFNAPTSLRAEDGHDVQLSIDINIQKIIQTELEKAIKLYDVKEGGEVIVMQPHNGEILGMASWPYFASSDPTACPPDQDPDTWDDSREETIEFLSSAVWRNSAISDSYEPGSTMKALTAAMALEEAITNENETVLCRPFPLFNWTISCAHAGGHGEESFETSFWRSCNPVFAKMSLDLGINRFYHYVRLFGLINKTGIDLPGEGLGLMHKSPTELDMATLSFGESSTVTPIQMVTAYCSFANGGRLIRPRVVRFVSSAKGEQMQTTKPETVRQIVSERTAGRIRELLKGVVLYGTGSAAYVEGYQIAGKTSTSTDDNGDHTVSFISMAPADHPEIVVSVILNKPEDRNLTSKIAALSCGRITAQILEYLGADRVYTEADLSALVLKKAVPDVTGLSYKEALRVLSEQGFNAQTEQTMNQSQIVDYQWPAKGTELHNNGLVMLYPEPLQQTAKVVVPDFQGRTVHECLKIAADNKLNIIIDGSCLGLVHNQDPAPFLLSDETDDHQSAEEEDETKESQRELKPGDWVTVEFATIEEEFAPVSETE